MPSGGARARGGRPRDENALRTDRQVGEWVVLPQEGRAGDPPPWPLDMQSAREAALWAEFWAKPQAIMWERNGQVHEVAVFVRRFAEAEKPESAVGLSTLVRQMFDSLGLSVPGMRANRWKIEQTPEVPALKPAPGGGVTGSARDRFRVA